MSVAPGSADDFNRRLQAALQRAQVSPSAAPTPPSQPGAPPPDDFNGRLATALRQARGEPATVTVEEDENEEISGGPMGAGEYSLREGDCISSIAVEYGLFWKTIWDDPANSDLKAAREDPNVLMAGDRLTIPEKRRKDETIAAEQRHRFVRKGEPSKVHIRLLEHDVPLANLPYILQVDHRPPITGTTDGNGNVSLPIPGNARRAVLRVGTAGDEREYELELGTMPPVSEYAGVQRRLRNLGYYIERIDGSEDNATTAAIAAFQRDHGLDETGEADSATRDQIKAEHGS